jgi:hypothetical protein
VLPQAGRKTILTLAALAVWGFVLWRALIGFTPSNEKNDVSFNSDSAIAVMMANDDRPITIFNAYYYCADRWGAWPFLIAQGIRRATGYTWTAISVFAMQAVWVMLGAWACAGLCRRDWAIAGLAYLIAVCLHPGSRLLLFELSQIYGWQLTGLLFAWMGSRRVLDSVTRPRPEAGAAARAGTAAVAGWFLFTLVFSLLTVWSSVASLPMLIVLCAIECVRAWARGRAERRPEHGSPSVSWPALATGSAVAFVAVGAGAFLERLLKMQYHRWSLEHYNNDFSTTFHIDHGHLLDSLGAQLMHLVRQPWWPLYALSIVALIVLAAMAVYALATRKAAPRLAVMRVLADDTAMTVLGGMAIAALNFTLVVLVDHVRLNNYDSRYLTLTHISLSSSGMLTLYLLIRMAARPASLRVFVQPAFVCAAIVLLVVMFPATSYSTRYRVHAMTARLLVEKAPRGVLLGDYWDTYVFVALQPPERAMTPVTWENFTRTPWTAAAIRPAREVIVVYSKGYWGGPPVTMPGVVQQHGATLRLADPHFLENYYYQFGRYINDTPANTAADTPDAAR